MAALAAGLGLQGGHGRRRLPLHGLRRLGIARFWVRSLGRGLRSWLLGARILGRFQWPLGVNGLIAATGGRLALAASGGLWRNGLGADVAGGGKPALAAGVGLRSKIIGGLAGLGRGGR